MHLTDLSRSGSRIHVYKSIIPAFDDLGWTPAPDEDFRVIPTTDDAVNVFEFFNHSSELCGAGKPFLDTSLHS